MLNSILVILCLIAVSAFFSISEISLAASRKIKLKLLADDGTDSVVLPAKGQSLAPDTPVVTRGTALLKAMLAQP